MTPTHLEHLRIMSQDISFASEERESIKAALEEREAALEKIRKYADSGSNPATHKVMSELLTIYGERPAAGERGMG